MTDPINDPEVVEALAEVDMQISEEGGSPLLTEIVLSKALRAAQERIMALEESRIPMVDWDKKLAEKNAALSNRNARIMELEKKRDEALAKLNKSLLENSQLTSKLSEYHKDASECCGEKAQTRIAELEAERDHYLDHLRQMRDDVYRCRHMLNRWSARDAIDILDKRLFISEGFSHLTDERSKDKEIK